VSGPFLIYKKGPVPNGTVVHQILVTWRRWEIASLIQLHALCYPNSAIRVLSPYSGRRERPGNMQVKSKAPLVIPVMIIVVGVGWLLTAQGVNPGINWIWTLGLGVIGILTFVVSGIDKLTVVVGPFFLLASALSVLRQTDNLRLDMEVPVLVISIGVLLLVAQLPVIPKPGWYEATPPPASEEASPPKKLRL
jgi:hypothetical protein